MKYPYLVVILFSIILNSLFSQSPGTEIIHPKIHFQIDPIPQPLPAVYFERQGWNAGVNDFGDFEITESFVANGVSVIIAQGPIYAKRSDGFVGLGYSFFGPPTADVEIRQNATAVNTSKGLKLTDGEDSWNMFVSAADNLVFYDPAGDLRAYIQDGTGAFVITSDERLKENFSSPISVLEKINRLSPTWYNYKSNDKRVLGFVAQEVEKIFPDFVDTSSSGIKGINYDAFGPLAIQAIKEQEDKIAALESKLKQYEQLEARIAALEK